MTDAAPPDDRDGAWRGLGRWAASLIVVLAAHAAVAAGLLAWPEPLDHGAPPSSPILIDLTPAATPMASIEDVAKLIPEPEMAEPPATVRNPVLDMLPTPEPPPEVKIEIAIDIPPPEPPPPVDLKPPPPPKAVQAPPPKPPEKVVTKRAESSRAPPGPAPVAATASGAPSPAPPASTPAPRANPQAAVAWRGALLAHLARHKRYPSASQSRGDEGVVYLRFTMTRQGAVMAQSIEKPSGHALLDLEASDLVRRAQPLPAPPVDVPGERFEFVVPVQFRLR